MAEQKTYDNEKQCGLWAKDGQYGEYFSGKIKVEGKEYYVNLYKNVSDNENAPVYKVKLNPVDKANAPKKAEPSPSGFANLEEEIPF